MPSRSSGARQQAEFVKVFHAPPAGCCRLTPPPRSAQTLFAKVHPCCSTTCPQALFWYEISATALVWNRR